MGMQLISNTVEGYDENQSYLCYQMNEYSKRLF